MPHIRPGIIGHHLNHNARGFGFFEQKLGLVRIVFWIGGGAGSVPRRNRGVVPVGGVATAVKYDVFDVGMFRGVGSGLAQPLVG